MLVISIIIPAHNEADTILTLLNAVQSGIKTVSEVSFEVIVVNDSSTDDTAELLMQNKHLFDKVIHLPKQCGKGGAVHSALQEATGKFVLFQDADLEYNPLDYEKLIRPVLEFDSDVVMGSRFVGSEWTRVQYFWHKVGNRLITLFFNILNNTTFTDIYCCYLLYRRSLVPRKKIRTMGWDQHGEILALAVRNGKIFFEVPVNYRGRTYSEGKKIRPHHFFTVIWTILTTRLRRDVRN